MAPDPVLEFLWAWFSSRKRRQIIYIILYNIYIPPPKHILYALEGVRIVWHIFMESRICDRACQMKGVEKSQI